MVKHFGLGDKANVGDTRNEFAFTIYRLPDADINKNMNFEK